MTLQKRTKRRKQALLVFMTFLIIGLVGTGFMKHAEAKSTSTETYMATFAPMKVTNFLMEKKSDVMRFFKEQQAANEEASYYHDQAAADLAMQSTWSIMPNTASKGDVVLVRSQEPGEIHWQGKNYSLQPFKTGYYTYLPISMQTKPGSYKIGNQTLTITEKKFETQYLQVSKENQAIRQNTAQIMKDQKKIDKARSQSADEFLFPADSTFIQPVEGPVTTPFGYTRYVNGEYSGSHTAIDWAAPTGTPVKATNDGIVALAEDFHLTGKSIYIDHGMDMFSQYIHMSELKVKAGDEVKKGDVIGLVGSTGFSTGPHMHFTFWVHNKPVNPNMYLGKTPFQVNKPVE